MGSVMPSANNTHALFLEAAQAQAASFQLSALSQTPHFNLVLSADNDGPSRSKVISSGRPQIPPSESLSSQQQLH